jgi:hypothetical protein
LIICFIQYFFATSQQNPNGNGDFDTFYISHSNNIGGNASIYTYLPKVEIMAHPSGEFPNLVEKCQLLHQMAMMSLQQQTQQQHRFYYLYLLLQCKIGCDFGARKAEGGCWRLDSSRGSPTTNTITCTGSLLFYLLRADRNV